MVYACAKLGLILCAINPIYQSNELDNFLRISQIKAIFMPGLKSKQIIINDYHKVLIDVLNKTPRVSYECAIISKI